MLILLSINPSHVQNILTGKKTFEFRRRLFARQEVKTVIIYCTRPISRFVGQFEIDDILCDRPGRLWRKTRSGSGISKQHFDEYFAGRDKAFALQIGKVRVFAPYIEPSDIIENFTPPQSFMYLPSRVDNKRYAASCHLIMIIVLGVSGVGKTTFV
jgi:predicted transcriptional regulator